MVRKKYRFGKCLNRFRLRLALGTAAGLMALALTACAGGNGASDAITESAQSASGETGVPKAGEGQNGSGAESGSEAGASGSGVESGSQAGASGSGAESGSEAGASGSGVESGIGAGQPEATVEPTPSAEEIYAEAVQLSLMHEGNYARLKAFIEKLRAGEKVTIAILGGSVTEGAGAGSNDKGYAYQFVEELGKTYAVAPEEQLYYVIAGLSGTPSCLGLMRYQQDVIEPLGQAPDLLIIEFAVNDWQEVTGGRAYESLVYEALKAKEDCAVISLCSVARTAWNTQESFLTIAKHYQIPLVSLKKAVFTPLGDFRISSGLYFSDDYHPKFYGHKLMKDCLMNLFEKADAAPEGDPAPIPEEAVKGRDFTGMKQIDSRHQVKGLKAGSFGGTDEQVVTTFFTKAISFPNNFYHEAGAKNDPMKLSVKCKKILVNYKTSTSKDFGEASFYLDGELVATLNGNGAGAWNNCNVALLLDEDESASHILEVKMAEGSEDKAFTILSISYCE